jgi:polysaccharide pyruvyl transferase CsaB
LARLLLAGYFGSGNLGDDAILMGFLEAAKGRRYDVKAVCGDVEQLMRRTGVTGVHKRNFAGIRAAIAECDAVVFPGGSLFQDVTSARSVAYYAKLVAEGKKAGKKVALLGQGVGPLRGVCTKRWAAKAFDSSDLVVVRDPASASTLKSIGARCTPKMGADMAWLLPEPQAASDSQAYGAAGAKAVGISIRPFGGDKSRHVVSVFADLARMLTQNGYIPTFIEMDTVHDGPLILEVAKKVGGKVPDMRGIGSPVALQQRLSRMEAVIAMRLHAGILAATVGVPVYLVNYDPKVAALANVLGAPTPPTVQGLTAQRLFEGFQGFVKDRDRVSQALRKRRDELAAQAMANIEALDALLAR